MIKTKPNPQDPSPVKGRKRIGVHYFRMLEGKPKLAVSDFWNSERKKDNSDMSQTRAATSPSTNATESDTPTSFDINNIADMLFKSLAGLGLNRNTVKLLISFSLILLGLAAAANAESDEDRNYYGFFVAQFLAENMNGTLLGLNFFGLPQNGYNETQGWGEATAACGLMPAHVSVYGPPDLQFWGPWNPAAYGLCPNMVDGLGGIYSNSSSPTAAGSFTTAVDCLAMQPFVSWACDRKFPKTSEAIDPKDIALTVVGGFVLISGTAFAVGVSIAAARKALRDVATNGTLEGPGYFRALVQSTAHLFGNGSRFSNRQDSRAADSERRPINAAP